MGGDGRNSSRVELWIRNPRFSPGTPVIRNPDLKVSDYLVTIDRDCRKLFLVNRERKTCEPVAEIEQRLDHVLEGSLSDDARKWNRGLKTIRSIPGGYLLCDIFGIYRLDRQF